MNSAARALVKAKEKNKNIVKILKYDWEPDHPLPLRTVRANSGKYGQCLKDSWEVS